MIYGRYIELNIVGDNQHDYHFWNISILAGTSKVPQGEMKEKRRKPIKQPVAAGCSFFHVFIPKNVKTSPSSTHIPLVMLFNYVKLLFYCNPSTPGNDPLVLSTVSAVTHRNDGMISNVVFHIHLKSTSGQEGGYFPTMPMWKTSGDPAILRGTVAGYGREYSATSAQSCGRTSETG